MNTEADILALTYDDRCEIYRPVKVTLNSGETEFNSGTQGQRVYADIPCALSSRTGGILIQSKSTSGTPSGYTLFVRPEIKTEPNDTIVITAKSGKQITAVAGLPNGFVSHNEIPLKLSLQKGTLNEFDVLHR